MACVKFLILAGALLQCVLSANILYISPLPSPSHHIWNKALAKGLVKKGHHVTFVTHDVEKDDQNFNVIYMEGVYDKLHEVFDPEEFAEKNIVAAAWNLYDLNIFLCEGAYGTKGFKKLLDYPKNYKFDLMVFDISLGNRCFYPLLERFGSPPSVMVTPFLLPPMLADLFGYHWHTSYEPYYASHYNSKMSFFQRLVNFVLVNLDVWYKYKIANPRENELVLSKFPNLSKPVEELERSVGLLLCNVDPVMDYPMHLPPNIIPVGGLHARPANPLPEDLKNIMDQAEDGVVLFSLGTNVRSADLSSEIKQNLLKAFSKLAQTVIWKFETDDVGQIPKNVIIRKWLPQNDMLGHPNIKLFVNHGGALSTQEAMYHGVPVVGIPFFADQFANMQKMEVKNIAKVLDRTKLTFDNIYSTLHEVIHSKEIRKNMVNLSKRYHHQPQTALERGIFWIEYILTHGSVKHLEPKSRDLSFFVTSNLDVLAVIVFILVLVCYGVLALVANLFALKKEAKTKKVKKN